MKHHQVEIRDEFNEDTIELFAKALIQMYELTASDTLKVLSPGKEYVVRVDENNGGQIGGKSCLEL